MLMNLLYFLGNTIIQVNISKLQLCFSFTKYYRKIVKIKRAYLIHLNRIQFKNRNNNSIKPYTAKN